VAVAAQLETAGRLAMQASCLAASQLIFQKNCKAYNSMVIEKHDLEKRLSQLKQEVLARPAERHISVLKCITDLPPGLQSPTVATLAPSEAIQTIIIFPPQIQHGWQYAPKQALLFTSTDVIHLLASIWPDQQPQVICLEGDGIMYMKVKLLYIPSADRYSLLFSDRATGF
jgi:hypothetical protein